MPRPRPGLPSRPAPHPAVLTCSPSSSPGRCSRRPSSSGSPRAPTPRCARRVGPTSSSGSAGTRHRPTRRGARRRRVHARRTRAGAGDPRPGPRPRPGQRRSPTTPPAAPGSSTSGRAPRRRAARRSPRWTTGSPACSPTSQPRATSSTRCRRSTTTGWRTPTPAEGWDVAHQVAHLAWTDEVAVLAATDKEAWDAGVLEAARRPERLRRRGRGGGRRRSRRRAAGPLARGARPAGRDAGRAPRRRESPWFGPPMSPTSMATARFMETWAHGLDVAEASRRAVPPRRPGPARGPPRRAHPRLRVRDQRPRAAGRGASTSSLTLPGGARRELRARPTPRSGPRVGLRLRAACHPAAAPRRPRPGRRPAPDADQWLDIAQAFAGPPGAGDGPSPWLDVLRVGNCSGFYGDRLSAMREMLLEGGELDVLTGDYLAELTMLILGRDQMKDPSLGYARTFVTPGRGLPRARPGARASGSSPTPAASTPPAWPRSSARSRRPGPGPAGRVRRRRRPARPRRRSLGHRRRQAADRQRLPRCVRHRGRPPPGRRHRRHRPGHRRLGRRRPGDRALRLGPRRLRRSSPAPSSPGTSSSAAPRPPAATSAASGVLRETGLDSRRWASRSPRSHADGSCVITKHPGTGGAVTVDTVTAQLVYEIQSTRYLGPDVTTHLDTIGSPRTAATGSGSPASRVGRRRQTPRSASTSSAASATRPSWSSTGLDIDAKAAWVRAQVEAALEGSGPPAAVDWSLARTDHEDADTEEAAQRPAAGRRPRPVAGQGRQGLHRAARRARARRPTRASRMTAPPLPGTPYGVYQPYLRPAGRRAARRAPPRRHRRRTFAPPRDAGRAREASRDELAASEAQPVPASRPSGAERSGVPLGPSCTRVSGDKGGDANLGLWVTRRGRRPDRATGCSATSPPTSYAGCCRRPSRLEVEVVPAAQPQRRERPGPRSARRGRRRVAAGSTRRPRGWASGRGRRYVDVPEELL